MNERGLVILEQYDFRVLSIRRGRGSFLLDTDTGWKLVTEYSGSGKRLQFSNRLLHLLREKGHHNVDIICPNTQGELITRDRDETGYMVKQWYDGRECDTKNEREILMTISNLAQLHKSMEMAPLPEEMEYKGEPAVEELGRRNRELKKVRAYMRSRQRKNGFEQSFLNSFEEFYSQGLEAEQEMGAAKYGQLLPDALEKGLLCHGDYNQHHVLQVRGQMATTNFEHTRYDIQIRDLYQILRKIMEKQNWNKNLGMKMLGEYEKIRPLTEAERGYLRIRLSYPEKFWKLANYYYNSNKAWIPGKNLEKLELLNNQQKQKKTFVKLL